MKVKRLKSDCCGMVVGQIYEAELLCGGSYVRCKLSNGDWTDSHWIGDWFEVIQ